MFQFQGLLEKVFHEKNPRQMDEIWASFLWFYLLRNIYRGGFSIRERRSTQGITLTWFMMNQESLVNNKENSFGNYLKFKSIIEDGFPKNDQG